jgi:hypothetical protein
MLQDNSTECKSDLNLLPAALRYAEQGWHVFPCMPGTKAPATGKGGFHHGTTDPEQIKAWWSSWPDANIGVHLDASGHCAVDFDRGADWLDLPDTLIVGTPSGGEHLIFTGSIPSSEKKLAAYVDTRGVGGYTLFPPSVVDEREPKAAKDPTRCGPYLWRNKLKPATVPAWVGEKLAKPACEPQRATPDVDLDDPRRVALVQEIARLAEPAVEFQASDLATANLANSLLDISGYETVIDAMVTEWMPRCEGEWDAEWVEAKVCSRRGPGSGRQNDIGCMPDERVYEMLETFTFLKLEQPEPPTQIRWPQFGEEQRRRKRFAFRDPEIDANLPPLTYYDAEQTLPNVPDGAVMVVTGPKSTHKTGVVMKKCLDAIERCDAKVLYLALEGGHGIKTLRLPLYREQRNMPWEKLKRHWHTETSFNLITDGAALVEEATEAGFKPDIIVIDTLTKAVAGQDINTPATGSGIHEAADKLSVAFGGALVILIHHPGKSTTDKSSMGSALIEALAYAVWHVSKAGDDAVKCWVEKMKDGKAEFAVHYHVQKVREAPCVRDETREERDARQPMKNPLRERVIAAFRDVPPGNVIDAGEMLRILNRNAPAGRSIGKNTLYDNADPNKKRIKKPCLLDLVAKDETGAPAEPLGFILPPGYEHEEEFQV